MRSGARCGFAAKLARVPLVAAALLPGGAAGAGLLLSAAGAAGAVGAPLGGWCVDRFGLLSGMKLRPSSLSSLGASTGGTLSACPTGRAGRARAAR